MVHINTVLSRKKLDPLISNIEIYTHYTSDLDQEYQCGFHLHQFHCVEFCISWIISVLEHFHIFISCMHVFSLCPLPFLFWVVSGFWLIHKSSSLSINLVESNLGIFLWFYSLIFLTSQLLEKLDFSFVSTDYMFWIS